MKTIIMLAFFAISSVCAYSQDMKNIDLNKKQQEVWDKVLTLHGAVFGTKDSATIANLVDSKLEYGHSGGNIENMHTMIHNASSSKTIYKDFTNTVLSVNVFGKVAAVRLIIKASSIDNDVATPLNLGILQVWEKTHGGWKLIERQAVKRK